jgi:hypothetical protein
MLLAVLSLMYIIMALNIVMFSLVPDYTMFGNQHFQRNVTGKYSQRFSVYAGPHGNVFRILHFSIMIWALRF